MAWHRALANTRQELEKALGQSLRALDVDSIAELLPAKEWLQIPNWGASGDTEIAEWAGLLDPALTGTIILITDPSFYDGGSAVVFDVAEIVSVFDQHLKETHEKVFGGGDVIMWSSDLNTLWLFHHEGVFAKVQIPSTQSIAR